MNWISRQWVRFAAAAPVLQILNYAMLAYSISGGSWRGAAGAFGGIIVLWLVGWFLLDGVKFQARSEVELTNRSPGWTRLFDGMDRIERRLNDLENR